MINTSKPFIFIFLGACMLSSCFKTERNCKDFHTGTFVFEQKINGEKHQTIFERTEDTQIEHYQGKTDTATVRWVNDCEFILQKKHPKNREEKKAIQMRILTTTQDGYTFEYSIVGDTKKQKGEAKIYKK